MWPYIREHKGKLIFCVICALIVGVCVAVQPLVIKYIVDSGISNDALMPNDKIRFVGMLCLLYIAIATTRVFIWRMGFTKMFRA